MKFDEDGVMRINEKGEEVPDPTPLELPAGFKHPESLAEMVRRLVRSEELSIAAENAGMETFDEAEDFNVDDDDFPSSPYEEIFDPALGRAITVEEFHKNYAEYSRRYEAAQDAAEKAALANEILQRRRREIPKPDAPSSPPSGEGGRKGEGDVQKEDKP